MKNDPSETLKEITRICKRAIEPIEIVTPPVYGEIFESVAKEKGLDSNIPTEAVEETLREQIDKFMELNDQSSRQIDSLDASSKKALDAMQENDADKLRESISEVETLRKEIERLKSHLYRDTLTKAYNRRWLDANYLNDEGRFVRDTTLAIVDLNYFKQINDTLGHIAGDKVLQFITRHLMETGASVVRYGGDEFILFFDFDRNGEMKATKKMQLCRRELLDKKLKFGGRTFQASFSYGVADAKKGDAFTDILEIADQRLYQDKKAIKTTVPSPF